MLADALLAADGCLAGILAEIALDLYVLRAITPFQTWFSNTVNGISTAPEDIDVALQLVDEWGRGFVAETDYRLEARRERARTSAHAQSASSIPHASADSA